MKKPSAQVRCKFCNDDPKKAASHRPSASQKQLISGTLPSGNPPPSYHELAGDDLGGFLECF